MIELPSIAPHPASMNDSTPRDLIASFLFLSLESAETLDQLSMPMFINDCLFIPSDELPALRQRIFLTINIPDSNEEIAVIAKVVWLNSSPRGIKGLDKKGYGIQFENGAEEMERIIERSVEHQARA